MAVFRVIPGSLLGGLYLAWDRTRVGCMKGKNLAPTTICGLIFILFKNLFCLGAPGSAEVALGNIQGTPGHQVKLRSPE